MKNNKPVFALVDCNNFFVSCERVFAPHLEEKAVVVLSSNDGCAISRSNEAKALGIKMGEPFYKFRSLYEEKKLEVFSSNSRLYTNMSWRIMESLKTFSPLVEVYSIDEAFLDLSSIEENKLNEFAYNIKQTVKQWTGIPVSVGIAPTKTLAKIASFLAKTHKGVYNLFNHRNLDLLLTDFPVEEIWGIGRKLASRLRIIGIGTAKDLRDSDPQMIRKRFSIIVEKIVYELRGISCLELTTIHEDKKSITHSRSFGSFITKLEELEEALSNYATSVCEKLRKQNSRAQTLCVSIRTNYFKKNDPQYSNSQLYTLPYPTNDTREIIYYGKKILHRIYKPGFKYHKLGVLLLDLEPDKIEQMQLFFKPNYKKSDKLMKTIDSLNKSLGKNTILFASQKIKPRWQTQSQNQSPHYTSNWEDLPIVNS